MAKKKSDPMLRIALHEVQQIMEKYDLAGNVCLVSKTHAGNTIRFPDWTGASVHCNDKGEETRVEMCIDVHALGKAEARRRAEAFVKCVNEIGMYSYGIAVQMRDLMEQMDSVLNKQPTLMRMMDAPHAPLSAHSLILNSKVEKSV